MSYAKVYSAQSSFLSPSIIEIEADISNGLHSFNIIGLADKAVDESKDRIGAAIKNSGLGLKSPKNKNQKVVISLAPAEVKKEGSSFDVAIALSYLLASKDISFDPKGKLFLGELSLQGDIRKVPGILPLTVFAERNGIKEIYVPSENAAEAGHIKGITVYAISHLRDLINHLHEKPTIGKENSRPFERAPLQKHPATIINHDQSKAEVDFEDVAGQQTAKKILEIAAAGGHNAAMWGPPGTGKSMLAKAFSGILPPLTFKEMLEITSIYSVCGILDRPLITEPPIRAPHHTSSYVSLVGGGANPRPGEITLAHRGVLFLDELPEFDKRVIESLRQPLEDRVITVSRAKGHSKFPAHFILLAAMNPCPCGFFGTNVKVCTCAPQHITNYRRKLSGPIMDRIDLWTEVSQVSHDTLSKNKTYGDNSETIRKRVISARKRQQERAKNLGLKSASNASLSSRNIIENTLTTDQAVKTLNVAAGRLTLSPRSYHRVLKCARTIADLSEEKEVGESHILEALQYRPKQLG